MTLLCIDQLCHRAIRCIFFAVCLAGSILGPIGSPHDADAAAARLHPKFGLPASCFAYVGDPDDPRTWKLPYLLADGHTDLKRLPAAIEAVTTGYRGKTVGGIPDDRVPDVLVRLGRAAADAGKMPFQNNKTAAVYRELQTRLERLGRLEEIKR